MWAPSPHLLLLPASSILSVTDDTAVYGKHIISYHHIWWVMLIRGHVWFHVILCRDDDHCFGPEICVGSPDANETRKHFRRLVGVTEKQRIIIQLLFALSDVLHVCNLLYHVEECLQPVSPTWQDAVRDSTHSQANKSNFLEVTHALRGCW